MKLAVCLSFYNMECQTYFAVSMGKTDWPDCDRVIFEVYGQPTAKARMALVDLALKEGCTHLLFPSSDSAWEPGDVKKLIDHDKPMVSGWGSSRFHPFTTNVADHVFADTKKFRMVKNPRLRHGLEKVKMYGELQLIKSKVFDIIKRPWFFGPDMFNGDSLMTEDTYFCLQCEKAGVGIWVDWDIPVVHLSEGWITHGGMHRTRTALVISRIPKK